MRARPRPGPLVRLRRPHSGRRRSTTGSSERSPSAPGTSCRWGTTWPRSVGRGVSSLTTDALSEGTHFEARSPPEWIGRAAVSASLSDLASKGGRPVAILLDILLPPRTPPGWAKAVVRGAERTAAAAGRHVVGGDTKSAASRSVVGTAIGAATSARISRRDGARPGDVVVVTGTVGRGGIRALARRSGRPGTLAGC